MKLTEHIIPGNILIDVVAPDRDSCLSQIVERLHTNGSLTEVEGPLAKLIEREEVMSTGIHPGVAVPHAYTAALKETICAIARVKDGVDFKSLDGTPVYLVFCLMGPTDAADHHLRLLARLARLIESPGFLDDLRRAATAESLLILLKSAERKFEDR